MIYLCSPYTHPDKDVVNERVRKTTEFVNQQLLEGKTIISPVVYGHSIVETCGSPSDWKYWGSFCHNVMDKCEEVWVLCIEGWEESEGIKGELGYAKVLGLKIKYQ